VLRLNDPRVIICSFFACLGMAVCDTSRASELELRAIVPDHVGYTLQKSPVLYYFISEATTLPTLFTLRDPRATQPVVEVLVHSPGRAGFQAIRLADYNVVLEPGVPYRWSITILQDPVSSSNNPVAGGLIECCPGDYALRVRQSSMEKGRSEK
jgi:hypothetical protein